MVTEIKIKIKGDESHFTQKFLNYEQFVFNENDPEIKKCIEEALSNSKIDDPEIVLYAKKLLR